MTEDVPANLKKAALFQLISGLINMFVLPMAISMGASICGALTFGLGAFCGLGVCILWPIGLFEVIAGGMSLAQPKTGAQLMKYATFAEFASILGGGFHSAVVGFMVTNMLNDAEVQMYLEG